MRPVYGSLPGRRMAQEGLARVRQAARSASLPVKILLVLAVLVIIVLALSLGARFWDLLVVAALAYGPVAVWRGHRSWVASVFVAAWGLMAVLAIAAVAGGSAPASSRCCCCRARRWPSRSCGCCPAVTCPAGRWP